MQPEFKMPDFLENISADEIHQRMMNNLPADIDDMPGGFPYDFTRPAALELDDFVNYYLMRSLMIMFPQYAWDEWLDLHGQQVHLKRKPAGKAYGTLLVTAVPGSLIPAGTVFCTAATQATPSVNFVTLTDALAGDDGTVQIGVSAVTEGTGSNVPAGTVTLMAKPDRNIVSVINPENITGGTDTEDNDAYYDRIAAEYENSMTYLGNDADYERWSRQAGAGDCIVIPAAEGPGTVKLVLVDGNGQPANEKLVQDVYHYIVSPDDRSARLLPTACAELICVPATTVQVSYTCTGLQYDSMTDPEQIVKEFADAVRKIYTKAKQEGVLRYNDVRPIMRDITGVTDFEIFLINGEMENIQLAAEEYPETGTVTFEAAGAAETQNDLTGADEGGEDGGEV